MAANIALVSLLAMVALSFADEDPGWELFVTNAGPATPRTCYNTPSLPSFVKGSFVIGGPAKFEMGGYKFQAIFDGLGKINRFELGDGQICYTSAWLNSDMYKQAVVDGAPLRGVLFEDTQPARPACGLKEPMCNLLAPNDNNWVSLIPMGGSEAALLSDSQKMLKFDFETMNCTGVRQWGDDAGSDGQKHPSWVYGMHEPIIGSAHPLLRPGTQTWVDILTEAPLMPFLGHSYLDIYTFEAATSSSQQKRTLMARIKTNGNHYLHSFGVTANYVILPLNIDMKMPSVTGTPLLMGNFAPTWDGIHIVDKEGNVQVFETEHFFHTHVANSFENETGIVLDLGVYDEMPFAKIPALDIEMFSNKTVRDSWPNRPGVRRLFFHLQGPLKGQTTSEELIPMGVSQLDFFKINMAHNGLPYCIYYATEWWHDAASFADMAILKHDICKGTKTYWTREHAYPGEPLFIGREDASSEEDDGVVVFVAIDGVRRTSIYVVLDAKTMEEIEVIELPTHIPFTAHGQFFPSGSKTNSIQKETSILLV